MTEDCGQVLSCLLFGLWSRDDGVKEQRSQGSMSVFDPGADLFIRPASTYRVVPGLVVQNTSSTETGGTMSL